MDVLLIPVNDSGNRRRSLRRPVVHDDDLVRSCGLRQDRVERGLQDFGTAVRNNDGSNGRGRLSVRLPLPRRRRHAVTSVLDSRRFNVNRRASTTGSLPHRRPRARRRRRTTRSRPHDAALRDSSRGELVNLDSAREQGEGDKRRARASNLEKRARSSTSPRTGSPAEGAGSGNTTIAIGLIHWPG